MPSELVGTFSVTLWPFFQNVTDVIGTLCALAGPAIAETVPAASSATAITPVMSSFAIFRIVGPIC
jgi:hypothetical protein